MEKDIETLKELYTHICAAEGLKRLPLYFGSVGKGGAVCSYIARTKRPVSIKIDLYRLQVGGAYALCHEVAHQIELTKNGNGAHNAKYKRTFDGLRKKYENCDIARKLIW